MGVYIRDGVEITGLTESTASDGTGTWNTGVDLDTIDPDGVPAGATGVLLFHRPGAEVYYAVRETGNTAPFGTMTENGHGRVSLYWCPLNEGTIDIYTENTTDPFYILLYTDSSFTFYDSDSDTFPVLSTGGGNQFRDPPSEIPSAATMLLYNIQDNTVRHGKDSTLTVGANEGAGGIIPLDSNGQYYGQGDIEIIGYSTADFDYSPTTKNVTDTYDSTWRTALPTTSNRAAAICQVKSAGSSVEYALRGTGSSMDPANSGTGPTGSNFARTFIVPLLDGSSFEYFADSAPGDEILRAYLYEAGASAFTEGVKSTSATIGVTGISATGTLYAVVTTNDTEPSAAQIAAGQDDTGSSATFDASDADPSSGENTFEVTGLTSGNTYYAYFVEDQDDAGDYSEVYSVSFSTIAGIELREVLGSAEGDSLANLTGIEVAVYDSLDGGSLLHSATDETTNGSSELAIEGPFTNTDIGDTVYLAIELSDGRTALAPVTVKETEA